MRKNSARKWLHATLDLLPVIIIPLFAIFMHRHDATTYEVEVSQNEVVEFNQYAYFPDNSNKYVSYTNMPDRDIINDYTLEITTPIGTTNPQVSFNYLPKGIYYYRFSWFDSGGSPFLVRAFNQGSDTALFYNQVTTSYYENRYTFNNEFRLNLTFNINPSYSNVSTQQLIKVNIINLTQMFGEGNEPTINEFNNYYSDDYYPYNTGTRQLLKDVSTVTYNNTDIGSQLVYALYTPINDYMNFNNVFNFGSIYDWLQLNIFNGNAPLSIFIVWNIFLYEFLMDLIFLLYALFMFFIDFCTNLIDRFHCKASGGH